MVWSTMDGTGLILLWLLSSLVVAAVERHPLNETSNNMLNETLSLKENFSKSITDTILKYNGFLEKFNVPYLGIESVVSYAKEIAKAIAFASMFKREDWVQEYAMKHIMLSTLPSSPNYCKDFWCTVTNIVNIITDVSVDGGFVSPSETQQVVEMKANSLTGNVLWRLSRLKNTDAGTLAIVKNSPMKVADKYSKFVNVLAGDIYKSDYVTSFCLSTNLDLVSSRALTSSVCGSKFMGYQLNLIPNMANNITHIYHNTKSMYLPSLSSTMDPLVVSSVIAEAIALSMVRQGYFENHDNLNEVAGDLLKLLMVGITNNRMHIHLYKSS